jgi:hypothetical protein
MNYKKEVRIMEQRIIGKNCIRKVVREHTESVVDILNKRDDCAELISNSPRFIDDEDGMADEIDQMDNNFGEIMIKLITEMTRDDIIDADDMLVFFNPFIVLDEARNELLVMDAFNATEA